MNITIRNATAEDFGTIARWAASEGWNPGIHDRDIFYNTDPNGFFIALDENGEIAGGISAVAYNEDFGFMGFFIVKPELRATGVGLRLANAALGYMGERTAGLDGVLAQQENYKKSGFKPAHRNIRHEGIAIQKNVSANIKPLNTIPFNEVLDYDTKMFSVARPQFLRPWIAQPAGTSLGYVDNGQLLGYGVIRECGTGHKIGPLFADTPGIAEELFIALSSTVPGETIFLDTPETNPDAVNLARLYSMKPVFETARMYKGDGYSIPVRDIYGITSYELG